MPWSRLDQRVLAGFFNRVPGDSRPLLPLFKEQCSNNCESFCDSESLQPQFQNLPSSSSLSQVLWLFRSSNGSYNIMQSATSISPCSNEAEEPLSVDGSHREWFKQRAVLLCCVFIQDKHEPQSGLPNVGKSTLFNAVGFLCPETGQEFSTYQDLLCYVRYAKAAQLSIYSPDQSKLSQYRDRRFTGSQEEFEQALLASTTVYIGNMSSTQ